MTSIRRLENRIRDAFSLIKEDMNLLKNSFISQKDKNSEFEKKIGVLDNRIDSLKEDIEELSDNIKDLESTKEDITKLKSVKEDVGEVHDLKKEIEIFRKELKDVKKEFKKGVKVKEKKVKEDEIGEKRDNLTIVFWVLLIALIVVVSIGLYYDWYGIFETGEEDFFKVLNVKEGDLVKLDVIAEDEDNDNLFITYSGPLGSNGEWQTKAGDKGEYSVTVTVSDGKETVSENVKIIVE